MPAARTALVAAPLLALATGLVGVGPAAAATPLTARLLTVQQFPGFQVSDKAHTVARATKADACTLVDPVGSVSATTELTRQIERSATRLDTTVIEEDVTRYPSAAAAASVFAKAVRLSESCVASDQEPGEKSSAHAVRAERVRGASKAVGVVVTTSYVGTDDGQRMVVRGNLRATFQLAGRHLVAIYVTQAVSTVSGSTENTVLVDDAGSRAIGLRAARLAVARLG